MNRFQLKQNAFYYFVLSIYFAAVLYILACGLNRLGDAQEYPYLPKGIFLLAVLGGWLFLNALGGLWARFRLPEKAAAHPRVMLTFECIIACGVLAASAVVRIWCVRNLPMQPESDYKTYYEIANLLKEGTLLTDGPGYCDYVAMFPHVLGYPYALSIVFRLFGTSVLTAQYFNVALAVGAVFLTYRIARRLGGRISGVLALCVSAFWPSQIIYNNFIASEYLFTFLLLLCIYVFVVTISFGGDTPNPGRCVLLLMALGVLLAVCAAVRPMAQIFLIAIILCMIPSKMRMPVRLLSNQPLMLRLLNKGWKRCAVVLASYLVFSTFFSMGSAYTVDRELASGSSSFGYNLLVGLNTESNGGWNEEDSELLYSSMEMTGSATEAHLTCRDLAIQRLVGNPKGIFDLMVKKFAVLWGNDDYGSSWNILFMDQQGSLTPERESFLYTMMDYNNLYYLIVVFFAGVFGVYLWKKGSSGAYAMVLVFVGTAALHLFVENQNRYHYHVLPVFAIFAALSVSCIFRQSRARVMEAEVEKERALHQKQLDAEMLAKLQQEEAELEKLREESMKRRFDVGTALKEGHVGILVSKAYEDEARSEAESAPDAGNAALGDAPQTNRAENGEIGSEGRTPWDGLEK